MNNLSNKGLDILSAYSATAKANSDRGKRTRKDLRASKMWGGDKGEDLGFLKEKGQRGVKQGGERR